MTVIVSQGPVMSCTIEPNARAPSRVLLGPKHRRPLVKSPHRPLVAFIQTAAFGGTRIARQMRTWRLSDKLVNITTTPRKRVGRRTARYAKPVNPAIRTTHKCHRIIECELLTGT
jgi:hypothetical protein